MEVLKISICLIFYFLQYASNSNNSKLIEILTNIFHEISNLDVSKLIENISILNDSKLHFSKIIENIRSKNFNNEEIEKGYNFENLTVFIQPSNQIPVEPINCDHKSNVSSSEFSFTPSLNSQDNGKTYKDIIIRTETNNKEMFYPKKSSNHTLIYGNENIFVVIRYIFCVYERINKLHEFSSNLDSVIPQLYLKVFVIIFKAFIHKKIENANSFEEKIRDILGSESYFLLNLDKILLSLIKSVQAINNDQNSKDLLDLFRNENNRKHSINESLYFANFCRQIDSPTFSIFRMLYSSQLRIMTIHFLEVSNTAVKGEEFDQFQSFLEQIQLLSCQRLEEEHLSLDQPFTLYLKRNLTSMFKNRKNIQDLEIENNLAVNFDRASKKLKFSSNTINYDFIYNKAKNTQIEENKKFLKQMKNSIRFRSWLKKLSVY